MKEPSFSLNDFRKWLLNSSKNSDIIIDHPGLKSGDHVSVRLSEENMIKKLKQFNPNKKDFKKACMCLRKNGAILKKIKGCNAEITISEINENLIVPRLFLRRPKKNN